MGFPTPQRGPKPSQGVLGAGGAPAPFFVAGGPGAGVTHWAATSDVPTDRLDHLSHTLRPYRIRIKTKIEDALILGSLLLIGVTGFFVEGARIAFEHKPAFEKWSFVGYGLANTVDTWSLHTLTTTHKWLWVIHVTAFL